MVEDQPNNENNILALEQVSLDPVLSGFAGVILELSEQEGSYTLFEMASGSGNKILKITSRDESFLREHFEKELEGFRQLSSFYEAARLSAENGASAGG